MSIQHDHESEFLATPVNVTYAGETRRTTMGGWQETADALIAKHGPGHGIPKAATVGPEEDDTEPPPDTQPAPPAMVAKRLTLVPRDSDPPPPPPVIAGGCFDAVGAARSEADAEAARAAGYTVARTVYTRGTRVIQDGIDNARSSRLDWAKQPLVEEYCRDFARVIAEEERADVQAPLTEISMAQTGLIVGPDGPLIPTRRAIHGLANRLELKGASYLSDSCDPPLRADNFNRQIDKWVNTEAETAKESTIVRAAYLAAGERPPAPSKPKEVVLRTRNAPAGSVATREVFAAVSPGYGAFDVDKVADAIAQAANLDGARGTVDYDGQRARFTLLYHSDVQPENYVAGEFFKAGIVIKTDDTGAGSIHVDGCIWQNLCLNLIIVDRSIVRLDSIRHVGTVDGMAARFGEALQKALGSLAAFKQRWGFACAADVVEQAKEVEPEVLRYTSDDIMAALFRGAMDRQLVPVPRKPATVDALMDLWREDASSARVVTPYSRAAYVNAFTAYAHRANDDAWKGDAISRAAGRVLVSNRPLPISLPEA